MLAILISRAKETGQIPGVVPHLVDEGLSILQYADDTIILMDNDLERAKNMKLLSSYQDLRSISTKVRCSVTE
jgi:hypothetical protein